MTKKELQNKIKEIRRYKAMAEEATNIQKALEHEISSYMEENNLTEEFTDSAKISYKEQTRKALDKKWKNTAVAISSDNVINIRETPSGVGKKLAEMENGDAVKVVGKSESGK